MTGAGLLHIGHFHTRRSFPGITFLAKSRNDGGRAPGVVDIGTARHCNGEQCECERGSVAKLHGRSNPKIRGVAIPRSYAHRGSQSWDALTGAGVCPTLGGLLYYENEPARPEPLTSTCNN